MRIYYWVLKMVWMLSHERIDGIDITLEFGVEQDVYESAKVYLWV